MALKKIKALMLIMMTGTLLSLSSCGKETASSLGSDMEGGKEDEDEDRDSKEDEEDEKENEAVIKADEEAKKAFEAFLDGNESVYYEDYGTSCCYSLQELVDFLSVQTRSENMPDSISEVKWSYIDCGEDGISELALSLNYKSWNEYDSPSEEVFVIRNTEDGLKTCLKGRAYYRTLFTLYDNGYACSEGSGGASLYYDELTIVDAEGENWKIYSKETHFGLENTVLPPDMIMFTDLEDSPLSDDFISGDKYQLAVYRFPDKNNEYSYANEDGGEWDSNKYLTSGYYVFQDNDGNEISPSKEYADLCAEYGINIVTQKEIDRMISGRKKDVGLDPGSDKGGEIDWNEIKDISDNYSIASQTALLEDYTSVWMERQLNEDMINATFAITDLNHNGRLEVLRCEEFAGDNTDILTRAYIYEVDEDFTSVSERVFEQNFDALVSFRPIEEDDIYFSIRVFFKTGESKYHYIVPTKVYTGYGYDVLMQDVMIDEYGNATAGDTLATCAVGLEDENLYYIDGKEVSEADYINAGSNAYPLSEGYSEGKVSFEYEDFRTADDLLDAMRKNAGWRFYYYIVNQAD